MKKRWFVYIIECCDKKLYTGITNDLKRRIKEHSAGHGCAFTRTRTPVTLVHNEKFQSRAEALRREAEIKSFSRIEKLDLIMRV